MSNTNNSLKGKINTNTIIGLGLLTAIVVVMQFISMGLRFGTFSITLTLIPIVVGSALYGWGSGAWLGFVFGVTVLLTGDANLFLAVNIPGTIITVILKGALAGAAAGFVYKLISKKNQIVAVIVSAIVAPVVNTGIFVLGSYVFFFDYLSGLAEGTNLFVFILVGLVGINFFIELGINLVLNPAILQIIRIGKRTSAEKPNYQDKIKNEGRKMDNNYLAELLFGDIKTTPEDMFAKYPARTLPDKAAVTRFAPSPTGFMHIGGLYAALISMCMARQSDGVFYLRLEDTDKSVKLNTEQMR